jgi:A/G-specific adenine glycosylase
MIAAKLIRWYSLHKRDLPWRNTKDSYKVWLSEVILQQTRVAQGLPYYEKFIEAFPTVHELAKAPEQKVLKLWQGLGYYSRARNLHAAAKEVVKNHRGKFPAEFAELKKLKGVGDYTAAAIASFCFGKAHAVVDGNVFRVLSRLFAIDTPINSTEGKKQFTELAAELIDKKDPGTYNQALMEFGATYCTPVNPNCEACIFKSVCASGTTGKAKNYPVKIRGKESRVRYFEYFMLHYKDNTYIEKRTGNDIWKNLYQLPLLEFGKKPSRQEVLEKLSGTVLGSKKFNVRSISPQKKHQLSHQQILARFWNVEISKAPATSEYKCVPFSQLKKYPFPVLVGNHLKEITIFE